jgi:hypothetical protein
MDRFDCPARSKSPKLPRLLHGEGFFARLAIKIAHTSPRRMRFGRFHSVRGT